MKELINKDKHMAEKQNVKMLEGKLESIMNRNIEEIAGHEDTDMQSFERLLIRSQRNLIKVNLLA